ncbi:MAG: hypothetical protein PHQ36_13710 [Anaerolineales bacterium]|nr:hypothetical protein [Anaerolineales bacterium]
MNIPYLDLITGALSFLFTLLIFSYAIGDNPLFRIGVYIFVGVSAGYIAAIAFWQVLWARLIYPLMDASTPALDKAFLAVPLLLAALILTKVSPRLAGLASIAMAFLVGIGAAVTIVGAVAGTLIPQITGTINAFDMNAAAAQNVNMFEALFNGAFILAGVIFSLSYFHFGAHPQSDGSMRRLGIVELMAWIGRVFIGVTLGAVFAGLYSAALTALIERINSLINFIGNFL